MVRGLEIDIVLGLYIYIKRERERERLKVSGLERQIFEIRCLEKEAKIGN